jgi:hypothetical protein
MKRLVIFLLSSFLLIVIMLAVAVQLPNSLPVGSDFSALYYADLALVNGVRVYDIPNMEALAHSKTDIPPENSSCRASPTRPGTCWARSIWGCSRSDPRERCGFNSTS